MAFKNQMATHVKKRIQLILALQQCCFICKQRVVFVVRLIEHSD